MKRNPIVFSLIALALLLSGCGGESTETTPVTTTVQASVSESTETPTVSAAAEISAAETQEAATETVLLEPRSQDLFGIWECPYIPDDSSGSQFNKDEQYTARLVLDEDYGWDSRILDSAGNTVDYSSDIGTFSADNGTITVVCSYRSEPLSFSYEQVGREILILSGNGTTLELTRNPADDYYMIGEWESVASAADYGLENLDSNAEVKVHLSLMEDGSCQVYLILLDGTIDSEQVGTYSCSSGYLEYELPSTLTDGNTFYMYKYTLNKDSLTLFDSASSTEVIFTRVNS